jgi:nickel/cobalt transporter (NicO) family protein
LGPQFFVDVQGWLYGGATAKLKSIAAGMDPFNLVAAIAVAAAFGLVHALMPGHGKTVVVSYYLGRPATVLSGLCTSVILVFTHVGSAIVLVLAGIMVMRHTLGGAGRAPQLETMSSAAIIVIGLWLLYRAVRAHDHAREGADSRLLAFATGLVPCPLTTFIMVYATVHGIVIAGLLVTAGMAFGMILTIASFALAAVLLRDRLMELLERTAHFRNRLGRILELGSALAIVSFGVWLLAMR